MNPAREQFLEERRRGIGGSDAGGIYSMDFGCRLALWYDKRNVRPDFPQEETPEMRRGTLLEDDVVAEYEAQTGEQVRIDRSLQVSNHSPFAIAHLDGWLDDLEDGLGIFEAKALGQFAFRRATKNGLRESYILQLQHGMLVTNTTWGVFAILSIDPWKLAWFRVERDDYLITKMVADEADFWRQVENGPMPEPLETAPNDKRCHTCPWRRQCQGDKLLEAIPEKDREEEIEQDPTLAQLAEEYEEAKALVDEAESLKEEKRGELITALKGRNAVDTGAVRVYHRQHSQTRWDEKALTDRFKRDALFQTLMGKYRKPIPQQPLKTFRV